MAQNNNILQELSELNSSLVNVASQNVYTVPNGYFDGLASQVLNRVRAMEATNAADEIGFLSPTLNNVSRQMPFAVPSGYFDELAEQALQSVRESNDYQTAKEEIESLSPLLSGLKKQNPYSIPTGYFEQLGMAPVKKEIKVVSITHRRWFRYAAAAVVTGLIVIGGFLFSNSSNRIDPIEQPYAWVKKNIKTVDKADIDAFVQLADEELISQSTVASNPVRPEEIKELMKDVSDKEIQEFLDETPDTDNNNDAVMN